MLRLFLLIPLVAFFNLSCGGGGGVPVVKKDAGSQGTVEAANSQPSKLQLSAFQELTGTDYLMASIGSPGEREGYSLGSRAPDTNYVRNYLFVNLVDKSSHLLLGKNDYLILEAKSLFEKSSQQEKTTLEKETTATPQPAPQKTNTPAENKAKDSLVKWIYYRIVKDDTDKDKHLTEQDNWTVALSDVSGLNYTELISDVKTIHYETIRGNAMILIYTAEGKNRISEINLQTKQVTVTKDLQEIDPK